MPAEFYDDLFEVKEYLKQPENYSSTKKLFLLYIMWLILVEIEIGNLHVLDVWKGSIPGLAISCWWLS